VRAHRLARPALGLILAALLLLALPGCAAGASAQRLVLLVQSDEGFYWENLLSGALLAAQDAGWQAEVRLLDPEADLASQLPSPAEASLAALALDGAQGAVSLESEVPLAALGCEVSGASAEIAGEETTIGKRTGQLIAQKLGLQKRFLLLSGAETYSQDDWEVALRGELGLQGSLISARLCTQSEEEAYAFCFSMLSQDSRIDGIVCRTQAATRGALRAVRTLGLQTPIVAADFDDDIALGLRDGLIPFSVVRNAYAYGYAGTEAALARVSGHWKDLPDRVDAVYVDANNMFDDEMLLYLYDID
jgi:ABC-type sugar transport system substrate-binding protein